MNGYWLAALIAGAGIALFVIGAIFGQPKVDRAFASLDHDEDGQFDGPTEQAIAEALAGVADDVDNWWRPRLTSVPLPGDTVPDDRPRRAFMNELRLVLIEEAEKQRGQR